MKLVDDLNLMRKYAVCPKCGCDTVGAGSGTLEIDDDTFKRTCHCGWGIEIKEVTNGDLL